MDEINQINEDEDIEMKDESQTFYETLSENQEIKERSKLSLKGGIEIFIIYKKSNKYKAIIYKKILHMVYVVIII